MVAYIECPACGVKVDSQVKVCGQCGFDLTGQTEAFNPLELTGGDESPVSTVSGTPQLMLIKGPSKGGIFYLEDFPVTIGRDTACDIFLNNRTVSRQHAVIEQVGDKLVISDKQSLNGTWVNGSVVESAELTDNCLLQIGTFMMRFNC